jgi:two-component system alkaline phosphatase synthesis response regulator PhoP
VPSEPEEFRVLVADDEPHIGRIIKMKLEQGPFRVSMAYDGREALEILEKTPHIDLVLLDVMMPVTSGLDVLAAMRADPRWRDLPCIILTAAGEAEYQRRAMAIGASEFLTKPFSPKRLYARAAELVGLTSDSGEAGLA